MDEDLKKPNYYPFMQKLRKKDQAISSMRRNVAGKNIPTESSLQSKPASTIPNVNEPDEPADGDEFFDCEEERK